MSETHLAAKDLPARIPIFPLAGCILLPRGRLPLNIFEPRYLEMCSDALSGQRIIGMVQPTEPESSGKRPPVYQTGCAGRITAFKETDDRRYLITLTGVCRFHVASEIETRKLYREIDADYAAYLHDLDPPQHVTLDRARLVASLKSYFELHGLTADWEAIEQCPCNSLVTSLAMICPFGPSEKQALLESKSLDERTELIFSLIEMGIHEGEAGLGPLPHYH